MVKSHTLAFLVVIVYLCMQNVKSSADENRLLNHLLRVGLRGRPVESPSQAWEVKFGLTLQNILDVDVETQTIELLVWHSVTWNDYLLKWNKTAYGGVDSIGLKPSWVVMPDITLYNAVSERKVLNAYDQVLVYPDGFVIYVPQVKQRALCSMEQESKNTTCVLKYGSWIYNGQKLNLTLNHNNVDVSSYLPNPDWDLTATSAKRNVKKYKCCPEEYIDLTFELTLTKK